MNAIEPEAAGPKKARVEIIPLIDVIFFLLATFVLFTLTLHRVRVLEADLPRAGEPSAVNDATAFIQTAVGGMICWRVGTGEPEPITLAELPLKLNSYKRQFAVHRVLLCSDGKAKLGAAVAVLDEVRRANIRDVAIETRPSQTGR